MHTKYPTALALALAAALTSSVSAQVLFYEGFDYATSSTVAGQGGWTGATNVTVNSGSLSFGGLLTSGNSARAASGGTIDISTGLTTPTTGVRWVSALMFQGAANFREQTIILMNGANEMIRFGNPGQNSPNSITMSNAGSYTFFNSAPAFSFNTGVAAASTPTVHFFALKYDYDATSITFYYNPTPGASEGSLVALGSVSASSGNLANIHMGLTGIRIRGNNLNEANAVGWDEIRIGNSFADVAPIPEPSSAAALAGLATLGLVAMRRRRRAAV